MTDVVAEVSRCGRLPPRIGHGSHRDWSLRSKATSSQKSVRPGTKYPGTSPKSKADNLVAANEVFA